VRRRPGTTSPARRLRRLRLQLAVAYALLALIPVVVLAAIANHFGVDRIDDEAHAQAQRQVFDVWHQLDIGVERPGDVPYWYVSGKDRYSDNYQPDNGIEPPLFQMQAAAGAGEHYEQFSQSGVTYLAYVRGYDDNAAVITVLDLDEYESRKASLRLRLSLVAAALVGASGIAGWFVAGRSLGPARQAVADQQGFLADAAHELRTPLAAILASASQALGRERSSEEYVRSLSEIRSSAERASAGVNHLLDLARFDSGQVIPRLAPLRLDLLAEEVAASIREDDTEVIAAPARPVVVDADMALLRQAVDNVVRNAARRARTVTLQAGIDGRDGVIEVLDDGAGFDPAVLEHVFDRFRRGDQRGNAGMGLAIVQAIMSTHGGVAEAGNRPEGGARVVLRVPLSPGVGN